MMKRMLLAAAAVATLATISFTAAPAEAKVVIYGGVPYHGYAVAPHWRYYYGRGWYDPYQYNYVQPSKMSCGLNAILMGIGFCKCNIGSNSVVEQQSIFKYHCNSTTQLRQTQLANIDAIECDAAR